MKSKIFTILVMFLLLLKVSSVSALVSKPTATNFLEAKKYEMRTFSMPAIAEQTVCGTVAFLKEVLPSQGPGKWTTNGSAVISNSSALSTEVHNLNPGQNIFVWMPIQGNPIDVVVNNLQQTPLILFEKKVCFNKDTIEVKAPVNGKGQWTSIGGTSSIEQSLEPRTPVSLSLGENVFRWTVNNNGCTSITEQKIINNSFTVDAGSNVETCSSTGFLDAKMPINGIGNWSIVAGKALILNPSNFKTGIINLGIGLNIFNWTVQSNSCIAYAYVDILNNSPLPANAGQSLEVCCGTVQLNAAPVTFGDGMWTSNSSAQILNPTLAKTMVSGLALGNNNFTWTVTKGTCASSASVLVVNTGNSSQTVCSNSARLSLPNAIQAAGVWSTTGSAQILTPNESSTYVTKLSAGANIFKWTPVNQGTAFTTTLINLQISQPLDSVRNICGTSDTLRIQLPEKATGIWTLLIGNGIISFPDKNVSLVSNMGDGVHLFNYKVNNNACISNLRLTLINNKSIVFAGLPAIVCGSSVSLQATQTLSGQKHYWSVVSGKGVFSSVTEKATNVTGLVAGINIFRYVVNNVGCESSSDVVITNNQPIVYIGKDQNILSDSLTLKGNPSPKDWKFEWSNLKGCGKILTPDSLVTKVTNLCETNIFKLSVTNGSCISSDTVTINYIKPPVANSDYTMEVCCGIAQIKSMPQDNWEGVWSTNGNASIESPKNYFTNVSNLAIGANVFTWTLSNNGFRITSKVTVINQSVGGVKANFEDTIIANKAFFKNKSLGNPTQFKWDFGNGAMDTIANPIYLYPKPGIYNVTLSVKNIKTGSVDNFSKTINIGEIPSLISSFEFIPKDSLNQIIFRNTSKGKLSKTFWDFGDGMTSDLFSPTHNYTKAGNFQVCLYVLDSLMSKKDVSCQTITVGQQKNDARFSFFINDKNLVNFKDISSGTANQWFWEFGDGSMSNAKNTDHIYAKGGVYKVCMTILDSISKFKSIDCQDVAIKSAVDSVRLISNFVSYSKSPSDSIYFYNKSQGPFTASYWSFGDGTISYQNSPAHKYAVPGVYLVCLNVYNKEKQLYSEYCAKVEQFGVKEYLFADFSFFIYNDQKVVSFSDASKGNANKWYWDFGDGHFDTIPNPKHVYSKDGIYNVCLQLSDAKNNLFESKCKKFEIRIKDILNIGGSLGFTTIVEAKKLVNFLNNSTGDLVRFYWSFGDGLMDTVFSPKHIYAKTGTYNVCLKAINAGGAISEWCTKVNVIDTSKIQNVDPIMFSDFEYFIDPNVNVVTFKDMSNISNRWRWDFGDATSDTLQTTKHAYKLAGIYKVCLTTIDKNNKFASVCKPVVLKTSKQNEINPMFIYFINPKDSTVTFSDQSTGPVNRWYWEFSNGVKAYSAQTVVKFNKSGIYKANLHIQDSVSKTLADHFEMIEINYKPKDSILVADFNFFAEKAKPIVSFVNNSHGGGTQWTWTFGDGISENGEKVSHLFKTAGLYNVCLQVLDKRNDKINQICKKVMVGDVACSVNADFSYFVDAKTQRVSFKNISTGNIEKYSWSFGGSASSLQMNPEYTFKTSGKFDVTLSVSGATKSCFNTKTQVINIGALPCGAEFTYAVDPINKKIDFKQISTGDAKSFVWEFGDGLFAQGDSVSHVFKKNGLVKVNLKVKGTSCFDQIAKEIQLGNINCHADFNFFVDSLKNTAQFKTIEVGNNTNYYWNFGDGANAVGTSIEHVFKAAGFYNVSLITKSVDGLCMDKKQISLLIGNRQKDVKADFDYNTASDGRTVVFLNKSVGDSLKYVWNFNDQTKSTDKTPAPHLYAKNGFYQVCLSAYTASGLRNVACKDVRVAKVDTIVVRSDFNYQVDVASMSASFVNNSIGNPDQFVWDFGDGSLATDANPKHTFADAKLYLVSLKVTNSLNNSSNISYQIVNLTTKDDAGVLFKLTGIKNTTQKGSGFSASFTSATNSKTGLIIWDFGDNTKDSSTIAPTHVYSKAGNYTVTLTVFDPSTNKSITTTQIVSVTSLGEVQTLNINTRLFPNPSNGVVTLEVQAEKASDFKIEILNTLSQIIVTETIQATSNFSRDYNLGIGFYLIRIQSENKSKVLKLIVQ